MKIVSTDHIHQLSQTSSQILKSIKTSDKNETLATVLPPDSSNEDSLVFISTVEQGLKAVERKSRHFIVAEKIVESLKANTSFKAENIWSAQNIQAAMALILPFFDHKPHLKHFGIHPQAYVDPRAEVHPTASIGPFCVVEAYAKIGKETELIANVYVGSYCEIGKRCRIAPNTTIGSDGFGFSSDKNYHHTKIPQIGKVVIEDYCEIGSNCSFDRATLTETRIKSGTKFDNLCHVAHNVTIGENSLITAGFIVAGSTQIGKNFTTAGGVHVTGHINITDNVVLTGRAGATSDITAPGMYGGFPIESHRESIKTLASLPSIKVLRKQVSRILKHLNLEEEK